MDANKIAMHVYQFSSLSKLVAYYQQEGRTCPLWALALDLRWPLFLALRGPPGLFERLLALRGLLLRFFAGYCFCRVVVLASGYPDLGRAFLAAACSREAKGDGHLNGMGMKQEGQHGTEGCWNWWQERKGEQKEEKEHEASEREEPRGQQPLRSEICRDKIDSIFPPVKQFLSMEMTRKTDQKTSYEKAARFDTRLNLTRMCILRNFLSVISKKLSRKPQTLCLSDLLSYYIG